MQALANKIQSQKDAINSYEHYLDIYPDLLQHIPDNTRLKMIGPKGMRIYQLQELTDSGMSVDIIASKIIISENRYKDFSIDELNKLNMMGLPDKVVTAMIQSTKDSRDKERRAEDSRRNNEEDRK